MRPKDETRAALIRNLISDYQNAVRPLPGIAGERNRTAFIEQLIESIRRIEFIRFIHGKTPSAAVIDPRNQHFDPLKAASVEQRNGRIDEGCWLVFLSVHFGRNRKSKWQLARDVYSALGRSQIWNWDYSSQHPEELEHWISENEERLKPDGVVRFGNHRKYESIGGGHKGTGKVIKSYIQWVLSIGSHTELVSAATQLVGTEQYALFDYFYRSMAVERFGRTARFDYLTMLGKLELMPISPGIPYLRGATGPLRGARLLFGGSANANLDIATLDTWVAELGTALHVGMQEMEDSLCNWQKNPERFVFFRG